ncbi:hypothetical protein NQ317_001802 [Molorchus minor]|uniref:Deltamethrin resistance protein prag01 domain-containing protein n=1 Tax=Molorchus minor TaxID=1323400 RepID=A0ABQ9JV83_9CUCU|nr:hypothetical protein NQ317_001802 [Molorchus minor]
MQRSRTLGRMVIQHFGRRQAHGEAHASAAQTTLNDLSQPQGSWKTHYDANQRKYNAQLVIGVGALIGTIVFGKAAGLLNFYNDIPETPATIDSYK